MKKISKIALLAALAVAGGVASAKPTDIGTGAGTYTFDGTKDSAFYVTLGPGTYSFQSEVSSQGQDLGGVWFATNHNKKQGGKGDFYDFTSSSATSFSGSYNTLTLTEETRIYMNVNTIWGKRAGPDAGFTGSLTVAAVPEPASAALLIAGLGAVGFVARRRRKA